MDTNKRIMIECRYLLSLNKSFNDLSNILNINYDVIKEDLNNKLFSIDKELYSRVQKNIKKYELDK